MAPFYLAIALKGQLVATVGCHSPIGTMRFSRAPGKRLVKQCIRHQPQRFRDHAHLPWNHPVTDPCFNRFKRFFCKIIGLHQEWHEVTIVLSQQRINVPGAQRDHLDAAAAQFTTQTFAISNNSRLAGTVSAMSGLAPNQCLWRHQ